MDKVIENLLIKLVNKTSEHFNLSFEDALAAVSQSKIANDIVSHGLPHNRNDDEISLKLFDEISKGY